MLLDAGAAADAVDSLGWCGLHFAALGTWPQHESHVAVMRLLIAAVGKAGQHTASAVDVADTLGMTPLHVATDVRMSAREAAVGGHVRARPLSHDRVAYCHCVTGWVVGSVCHGSVSAWL